MKQNNGSSAVSMSKNKSRKSWSRLPLKVKLIGFFLLFAFLLLVFLWLFQIVFLDDFYKMIKTSQIKSSTSYLCENIEDPDVEDLIETIHTGNGMSVAVYDTSTEFFTRVYESNTDRDMSLDIMPHQAYVYYIKATDAGGRVMIETEDAYGSLFGSGDSFDGRFQGEMPKIDSESSQILTCAQIVKTQSTEYFVVLKTRMTPVTSTVDTLMYQLVIITALLVIFAVVFAIAVSSVISKPIVKANEGAKELARQNYDVSFDAEGCKEICELSETLNIAAAELSTVDRLRRELIANISHDLRTPLTMISGYAEVMRDIPGENTPENLQVVIDESRRLSELVTDLLDLSKLEAQNLPVNMQEFCLTDCIRGIFSRYAKLVSQEGYVLKFESDCNVTVKGDEIRMGQVIYNLINNAINYAGEDKTVIVRQTLADGKVRIEVIDNGKGISQEDMKYIWDRYYRVDKEHRSAVIGSGLGLSIVKNVLLLHKARFGVKSKVGEGSNFWFELEACPNQIP